MQASQMDFKKLRSVISLEYGIELDETALAILAILLSEVKQQFVTMNKAQDAMAEQIQHSKKSLQVDPDHPRWQAFWHGMGQWGLGLCLAVISALTIFLIDVNNERAEKEAIQQELNWYKAHYEAAEKTSSKAVGASKKTPRSKNKRLK